MVFHVAMQDISLYVCAVMAGLTCALTQPATGVQPHPAPESNQTRPGEAVKPAIIHTYSHTTLLCHG